MAEAKTHMPFVSSSQNFNCALPILTFQTQILFEICSFRELCFVETKIFKLGIVHDWNRSKTSGEVIMCIQGLMIRRKLSHDVCLQLPDRNHGREYKWISRLASNCTRYWDGYGKDLIPVAPKGHFRLAKGSIFCSLLPCNKSWSQSESSLYMLSFLPFWMSNHYCWECHVV